jgi:hypothetical protein
MARVKPPLGLHAEITDANENSYRWDANARRAQDRPAGINFSTKLGDGFDQAGCSLPRRVDRDYPDLNLLDDLRLVGDDDFIAYEGQVGDLPRSMNSDGQAISVAAQGYMNYARRRTFDPLYIDCDLSGWGEPSTQRRANSEAANLKYMGDASVGSQDSGNLGPAIIHHFARLATTSGGGPFALVESFYYGGGVALGKLRYDFNVISGGAGAGGNADFDQYAILTDNDLDNISHDLSIDYNDVSYPGGPFTNQTVTATAESRRYAMFYFLYKGTFTGDGTWSCAWTNPKVIGRHRLIEQGTWPNIGFYASDMLRHSASLYAPKLSLDGVQNTTYPITHVPRGEKTPADFWLWLNGYHLWKLGVWENRTLTFEPFDFSEPDWEVRIGDPNISVSPTGDSISSTANGIVVNYTDFAGVTHRISPDTNPDLADTDPSLPANAHDEDDWTSITLSAPCLLADALQIGRAALAEFNRPKFPSTIVVQGHIQDPGGHWAQGWRVRAGQTVSIADHPNPLPRLITSTTWDQDSKTLTITTDNALNRVEAIQARQENALHAAGLL